MFENVKEWLAKGLFEKCIGFIILFIAVYGMIWGLMEPLISADIMEHYFGADILKHWWKYQILLSFVASLVIFYWLLPTKILQSFGSDIIDTRFQSDFQSHGTPKISVFTDGYYGDVFDIESDFSNDNVDWNLKLNAYKASTITYTYIPTNRFVLYLRVNLFTENEQKEQLCWIALRTDISLVPYSKGQLEVPYPVKGINAKNGWITTTVNINKAVKETFGRESYKYDSLRGLRIRGSGKVQRIVIR